jgi:hypothetical protein
MLTDTYERLTRCWLEDKNRFKATVAELFQHDTQRKCAKSYIHENGFAKITVLESDDKSAALRIHIWKDIQNESNIHSHCFNLTSTVLSGVVRDRVYVEDTSGREFNKFLYTRRGERVRYSLVPLGASRLSVLETRDKKAGDRYTHMFDTLHTSQPISGRAVTLFIADRRGAPDSALVYSNRYLVDGQDVESPALNQDQIMEHLSSNC